MDTESWLKAIEKSEEINGKHFSEYVKDVKDLKRKGKESQLESLLYKLIEATEAGDVISHWGVAPWYYEELAKFYRKRKDLRNEVMVLERFSKKRHAPGVTPPRLLKRLERARELLEKHKENE